MLSLFTVKFFLLYFILLNSVAAEKSYSSNTRLVTPIILRLYSTKKHEVIRQSIPAVGQGLSHIMSLVCDIVLLAQNNEIANKCLLGCNDLAEDTDCRSSFWYVVKIVPHTNGCSRLGKLWVEK